MGSFAYLGSIVFSSCFGNGVDNVKNGGKNVSIF